MVGQEESAMHISRSIRLLLVALVMLALPAASFAGVFVSVTVAPPVLPVYVQPICPGEGYIWTPGYWAYGDDGYFWVPGTWVLAPEVGFLWTPGYWGWGEGFYVWHAGYWGPHVGFYGGINYGFGYGGIGYEGGYWNHGAFYYNRTVNNVNITNIHNVYNRTIINNTRVNRVSFNGGRGGITARPTAAEEVAVREHHVQPTALQTRHEHAASTNREQLASVNHGRPAVAATPQPAEFRGSGAVKASRAGTPYKPAAERAAAAPRTNNSTPRPGHTTENKAAHREIASRAANAPRPRVTRPQRASESAKANEHRQESAPRAHNVSRPSSSRSESAPRTKAASRPPSAPHSQVARHAQSMPRPSAPPRETAHAQSPPRPGKQSHPSSGREERR
jgi:hypothetical protein